MVRFNWSWADYERLKRREERKAVSAVPAPPPEPEPEPEPGNDGGPMSIEAQLQFCKSCGKHMMQRCNYGRCPLL